MRIGRGALGAGLAGLLIAVMGAGCGGDGGAKLSRDIQATDMEITGPPEAVVATVDGLPVTMAEVNMLADQYAGMSARGGGAVPARKEMQLRALNNVIDQMVLAGEATRLGMAVPDSVVTQAISGWERQLGSPEARDKRLAEMHITFEQLHEKIRLDRLVQDFVRQKIQDTLQVRDADVAAFYEANPDQFESGEQVRARHILVTCDPNATSDVKAAARSKIEALRRRVQGGEDFATVAREKSDCPSKAQGGDLGFFTRERMVKPFADAAFAMQPGQISDVVETQFGYHVIKVEEHRPAGKIPLEQVTEQLRGYLKGQKFQEAITGVAARLRAQGKVKTAIQL